MTAGQPEYVVRHNGRELARSNWAPLAQAAWHRATRDQHTGGVVELVADGRLVASHRIVGGRGARWPCGPECGLRDIVKALLQLLRDDDWSVQEIAETMTDYGLPTSRARVDAMRGSAGRSIDLSAAEVETMIRAVLHSYKQSDQPPNR